MPKPDKDSKRKKYCNLQTWVQKSLINISKLSKVRYKDIIMTKEAWMIKCLKNFLKYPNRYEKNLFYKSAYQTKNNLWALSLPKTL